MSHLLHHLTPWELSGGPKGRCDVGLHSNDMSKQKSITCYQLTLQNCYDNTIQSLEYLLIPHFSFFLDIILECSPKAHLPPPTLFSCQSLYHIRVQYCLAQLWLLEDTSVGILIWLFNLPPFNLAIRVQFPPFNLALSIQMEKGRNLCQQINICTPHVISPLRLQQLHSLGIIMALCHVIT